MKILVSSIVDIKKSGHNSRLHQFLLYLSKKHDITVLCLNDTWKLKYDKNCLKFQESYADLFEKIDSRYLTNLKVTPFIQDILSMFFIPKLIKLIKDKRFDIHFSYNGLFSSFIMANILRLYKIPTVYDIADDLPNMSYTAPQIPNLLRGVSFALSKNIFIRNIRKASKITVTTEQLSILYGISPEKSCVVPNGVDYNLFRKKKSAFRNHHNLDDAFVIGFVGVLREWVDFEPFLNALTELTNQYNIKVVIIGDGIYSTQLKKAISEKSLDRYVIFTGAVNYDEVPDIINAFDVGLIPFKADSVSQNAIPLKLFEYFACEVPVISSPIKSIELLFGDKIMYAASESDYKQIIEYLITRNEERRKMGTCGRLETCDAYAWSNIAINLEKNLEQIC